MPIKHRIQERLISHEDYIKSGVDGARIRFIGAAAIYNSEAAGVIEVAEVIGMNNDAGWGC